MSTEHPERTHVGDDSEAVVSQDSPDVEPRDSKEVDPQEVGHQQGDAQRPGDSNDAAGPSKTSLLSAEATENLRGQWDAAQTTFVDDPRAAVERADHLVAETIQTLSASFTQERSRLEEKWARGEDVSTEDLRVALQLYRSFFDRLLGL